MHSSRRQLAGLLVVLSVLVGCGGDGGEKLGQATADAALLTLGDFPSHEGWRVDKSESEEDPTADAFEKEADACVADVSDPTEGNTAAEGESPIFVKGEYVLAQSYSVVTTNEKDAADAIEVVDEMVRCVGKALEKYLAELADVPVEVAEPYELSMRGFTDRTVARSIQMGANGVTFFLDFIVVQKDRTVLLAFFFHDGGLTPQDEETIVSPAAERAGARPVAA